MKHIIIIYNCFLKLKFLDVLSLLSSNVFINVLRIIIQGVHIWTIIVIDHEIVWVILIGVLFHWTVWIVSWKLSSDASWRCTKRIFHGVILKAVWSDLKLLSMDFKFSTALLSILISFLFRRRWFLLWPCLNCWFLWSWNYCLLL